MLACRLDATPQGFSCNNWNRPTRSWALLAERTRSGIKAAAAGRPCDTNLKARVESSEVMALLQPKPMAAKHQKDEVEPQPKKHKVERPVTKGQSPREGQAEPVHAHSLRALGPWMFGMHTTRQQNLFLVEPQEVYLESGESKMRERVAHLCNMLQAACRLGLPQQAVRVTIWSSPR